ncbi:MAG: DUF3014 domain-containing protein [Methylococcales bacterium]|nr:DUF3014 domain-containing protein [Methylococcales bacterium]
MSRYKQRKSNKYLPVLFLAGGAIVILIAFAVYWFLNNRDEGEVIKQKVKIPQENKLKVLGEETPFMNEAKKNNLDKQLEEKNSSTTEENSTGLLTPQSKKTTLVELENSDDSFKEAVIEVSEDFANWFEIKESIKKYITLIHDISQNQILVKNRAFLKISKKNMVKKDSQGLYLSKEGYKRYDDFANAIASIDAQKGLGLYLTFKPLFNKVYKTFSYPNAYRVEDIFLKAAANVIKAPIKEDRIALVKHSIYYKFSDKKLESLSDVEKQMLRMGPENTKKIQAKLRKLIEVMSTLNE